MGKLFILVGESGSGKSTIEKEIHKLGLANKVISTTTRKPRSYEIEGEDYHFISEMVFKTYLSQGQYAEWSQYTTVNGKAYYGINKNDIKLDRGNYVAVVNPHGARQLINSLGDDVVVIHIKRNDRDRVLSALNRDESDFDNVFREAYRRYKADKKDFSGLEDIVKYTVSNSGELSVVVENIKNIMEVECKYER